MSFIIYKWRNSVEVANINMEYYFFKSVGLKVVKTAPYPCSDQ